MSDIGTDPPKPPRRRPAKPQQAPAYLKGVQPLDTAKLLSQASEEDVRGLMKDNFALWAQASGVEVDGHIFSFDDHRYLLPIYLDNNKEIIWMKAAQLGATVYLLLRLLWFTRYHTVKAGLYFPTGDGVEAVSKDRLAPLIQSNPELYTNIADDVDTIGLKRINNVEDKASSLYMLYLGGKATKDSVPMDVVAFDEVRLVEEKDIDQALERISHSSFKYKMFMSTSGYPNEDIHKRFLLGKQFTWHSRCFCTDGVVLADVFPDCIAITDKEIYYRCPTCKARIRDPQNGRYIAHNPNAEASSYAVSQLISKFISAKEIWEFFQKTTNVKEFYNAKLGRPYVDEENRPVNDAVLDSCVDPNLCWANDLAASRERKQNCAMGVDQHSGNCYVVIAKRGPDGRKELVHLEIIESSNPNYWKPDPITGNIGPVTPFVRVHELMREFNVGLCVIDSMPNANEAQALARAFPGKVFLAWYKDMGQDMVQWTDRIKVKESIRRGSKDIRLKWQVILNRYMSMDFALKMLKDGVLKMPHPDKLVQVVRGIESGKFEAESVCRSRFRLHLKSLVRQKKVLDEDTGRFKMEWHYIGRDPHFAHAWNYCNIALERLRRGVLFGMA